MNSNYSKPVNLGNPEEYSIVQLATIIRDVIGNNNTIVFKEKVEDDPQRRRPNISIAK
jgi:UDP-glucuronate decarboxylase